MIQSLISLTLSNALGALALAVATVVVTRFVRTPALAHGLWILVLVKLISPAIVELPVRLPGDRPLLALRAPGAHTTKVHPGVSSRLGETRLLCHQRRSRMFVGAIRYLTWKTRNQSCPSPKNCIGQGTTILKLPSQTESFSIDKCK